MKNKGNGSLIAVLLAAVVVFGLFILLLPKEVEQPVCDEGLTLCSDGTCKESCTITPPVVDKLAENLVFYAPLTTDSVDKVSGKSGTVSGVTFSDGYAKSSGTGYIKYTYDAKTVNPSGVGISVCVKLDDPTKHSYFVSKYGSYTVQNYAFKNVTKQFHRFDGLIYKDSTQWSSAGKYAAVAGTWYHIVMNYDGALETLYVNKVVDGRSTLNYPIINNPSYGIMLMNREDNLQRGVVGGEKYARIYSKPMTSEQINLAYDECFK